MTDHPAGAEEVVRWARTTDFAPPLQWGVIEAQILSGPAPDVGSSRGPNPLMGVPLYAIGVAVYAAPVLGLGVLLARAIRAIPDSDAWGRFVIAAFLVALIIPLMTLEMWRSCGRRRRPMDLIVTAVSAVSAALGLIVLQRGGAEGDGGWLVVLVAGAALSGAGVFALILVGSRGWRRRTPRRLRPQTREDQGYNNLRARVLEELVKRGVVDEKEIDVSSMLDMPIGSWRELDGRG